MHCTKHIDSKVSQEKILFHAVKWRQLNTSGAIGKAVYFLGQSLNGRRLYAEVRLDEMKIGVLLQRPKGACQDINIVTRTKQLFGEGFSDSGTTTCDYIISHCVKMLGVMFAKAIGNERLERNIFVANKTL